MCARFLRSGDEIVRQSSLLHFESATDEVVTYPSPISLWLFMLQKEWRGGFSAAHRRVITRAHPARALHHRVKIFAPSARAFFFRDPRSIQRSFRITPAIRKNFQHVIGIIRRAGAARIFPRDENNWGNCLRKM